MINLQLTTIAIIRHPVRLKPPLKRKYLIPYRIDPMVSNQTTLISNLRPSSDVQPYSTRSKKSVSKQRGVLQNTV